MFSLGRVADLRETIEIPATFKDTDMVYKYGLTNDFSKRTQQHEAKYGKMKGVTMALKYHVYIDPLFLADAERDIEKYFQMADWHMSNKKYTELVCVSDKVINNIVHNEFKRLGMAYSGKLAELQTQLANEQRLNAELRKQNEAMERNNEQRIQDIKYYSEMLIKEKQIQIERLARDNDRYVREIERFIAESERYSTKHSKTGNASHGA